MEFPYIALDATFNQASMEQATEPISVQPRVQIMQMRKLVLAGAVAASFESFPRVSVAPFTIIVLFTAGPE
jgi:hypothetical protein